MTHDAYDIIAHMRINQQEVDRFVTDKKIDVTDWAQCQSIAEHFGTKFLVMCTIFTMNKNMSYI